MSETLGLQTADEIPDETPADEKGGSQVSALMCYHSWSSYLLCIHT